jgi:hypothetical protein
MRGLSMRVRYPRSQAAPRQGGGGKLQVTRSADERLSRTVRTVGSEIHGFSGTLEPMQVFEELVPVSDDALHSAEPGGDLDTPRGVDS